MAHDPSKPADPWNTDAWSAGVDSWWNAMSASRQMLQDLGDQVHSALGHTPQQVRLDDLQRVVAALGLVEERLSASAAQGEALSQRIDRIEAGLQGLTEQVALVARTVSALGGHIEALASKPAKKTPARKPKPSKG